MSEVYIVNCCRTAIGSFGGSLKDVPAADLGAIVVKEAMNRAGVKPEQVDELRLHPDGCSGAERCPPGGRQSRPAFLRSRLHGRHGVRLRHEVRH